MGCSKGLVGLSDDQPSQGNIHKLHEKKSETESQDKISRSQNENKTSDVVIEDKVIDSEKTKLADTQQKSLEKIKRRDYVRSKMQISKTKRALLLKGSKMTQKSKHICYKKQNYTAKCNVPKKEEAKENKGGEKSGLTEMELLKIQVENMITEGKTDADSIAKIETLKSILNMFKATQDVLKKDENIHKIDETNASIKNKENSTIKAQEGSEISNNSPDSINVIQEEKNVMSKVKVESSEESDSEKSVKKKVDSIIMNVDDKKEEKEHTVKQVTFAESANTKHSAGIDTMAQLDTFILDEDENSPPFTVSGQEEQTVSKSVLNEIVEAVAIQQDAGDDNPSDKSSCTPLCSQVPRIDPYAHKKENLCDEIG